MAPNSKFVGHSTEIIRQSKIKGPLKGQSDDTFTIFTLLTCKITLTWCQNFDYKVTVQSVASHNACHARMLQKIMPTTKSIYRWHRNCQHHDGSTLPLKGLGPHATQNFTLCHTESFLNADSSSSAFQVESSKEGELFDMFFVALVFKT